MSTLTDVRNEFTRAVESAQVPKPLYAVAGVGGLAIEKLRSVERRVRELPGSVVDAATTASDRAVEVYEGLSARGKKLVDGFASQRAVTITDAAPADTASEADEEQEPSRGTGANGTNKARTSKTSAGKTGAKASGKASTVNKTKKNA